MAKIITAILHAFLKNARVIQASTTQGGGHG